MSIITPQSQRSKTLWPILIPKPKTRNFLVGSVGSGKSTVGATLLEHYHWYYPKHEIYIIDPKERFFSDKSDSSLLFPDGVKAINHGRMDGVTVNARFLEHADDFRFGDTCFVIQNQDEVSKLLDWVWKHHDVRQPKLLYFDESVDYGSSRYIDPGLKRIIQMGREKGIGHLTINQRPKDIPQIFLSESERLYVMYLGDDYDRKRIVDVINVPDKKQFERPMPQYVCAMIESGKEQVRKFKVA